MLKISLTTACLFLLNTAAFNQSPRYIDKGLINFYGNIGFGSFLETGSNSVYIFSGADLYVSENISIHNSLNFWLSSTNKVAAPFSINHSFLTGFGFHLKTQNNFDPFISLQPGLAFSKVNQDPLLFDEFPSPANTLPKTTINPIFSLGAGGKYFANKIFDIYFHVQYVTGKHFSDIETMSLNEFKLSLGLGFHLWAKNKRVTFVKPE